jgi:BMFP domain-containing protein YqiC
MAERPRFFDDLAGVAGGAISALGGLRDEVEAIARNRADEVIRRLDLVKREELEAAMDLAANARAGQEAAEAKLADLLARVEALEARLAKLEAPKGGGGPGMIA